MADLAHLGPAIEPVEVDLSSLGPPQEKKKKTDKIPEFIVSGETVLKNPEAIPSGGELRPASAMQKFMLSLPQPIQGAADNLTKLASLAGEMGATPQGIIIAPLKKAAPIAKGLSKPIKPILNWTGDTLAEIVGEHIGAPKESVAEIFKNYPRIRQKIGERIGALHQENLVNALKEHMEALGRRFNAVQDTLAGFAGKVKEKPPTVQLKRALESTLQEMQRAGHRIPSEFTGVNPIAEGLIEQASPDYQLLLDRLKKLKDNPSADFGVGLNLKRQLDDLIDYGARGGQGIQEVSGEANRILKHMRNAVNSALRASIENPEVKKEWDELNGAYVRSSKAIAELKKNVVGQNPQQTAMRILRQIKAGSGEEATLSTASKLGKEAEQAMTDIYDRVVASGFQKKISSSFAGPLKLLSSPRLTGHLAGITGQLYGGLARLAQQAAANPGASSAIFQTLLKQKQIPGSQ